MSSLKQQIAATERQAQQHVTQLRGQAAERVLAVRDGLTSPWLLGGAGLLGFVLARSQLKKARRRDTKAGSDAAAGGGEGTAPADKPASDKPAWSADLLGALVSQLALGLATQWLKRQGQAASAGTTESPSDQGG